MKYYFIDHRTDKEVGNVYPQVDFINLKDAFKFQYNIFPKEELNLFAILEKGAKLTDILSQCSISANGLLINKKVKNIFSRFNLMNHKYYNCTIKDNSGNSYEYYWMALVQADLINLIDFNNSEFYTTEAGFRENNITLNDYNDFLVKKNKLPNHTWSIQTQSLKLIANNFNLLVLPHLYNEILITENIKKKLIEKKITGINIKKAPVFLKQELLE